MRLGRLDATVCRRYLRPMHVISRYFAAGILLFTAANSAFAFQAPDLTVEEECAVLLGKQPLFTLREIEPGVVHLSFTNYRDLTETFMRVQEHYESPRFRGLIFSRNK